MAENLAIFDFEIPADQMERLDHLTTPDAIFKFVELYRKCVTRDTELPASLAKTDITEG
jgi:diketogulonate reductase-like aldo/keto reductase